MISNEELANKILIYRAKNNITQKEFAKKIGISFSTLNQIENLKCNPTKITKTKILLCMKGDC